MKKVFFALAGLLLVSVCHGEEGVVLGRQDDAVPVGKVRVENFLMEMKEGKILITMTDRKMEGTMSIEEARKTRLEGLEGGKMRLTVMEEKKTEESTMAGQAKPPKITVSPLEGLPVIMQKGEDGKWSSALEKGEATPVLEAALAKVSERMNKNLNTRIYGTVPRKVGDEWDMEGEDLMGINGGTGTFKVKFEAIEQFKGEECAKLTGSMDITGETPAAPGTRGLGMRMSGEFTVYRSLKNLVDLSNVLKGKMEVGGEMAPQPGLVMTMKMEGPMVMTGSTSVSEAE